MPTRPSKTPAASRALKKPAARRDGRNLGPAILVRVFLLHQRLCSGREVNAATFAKELEVSQRTIYRDRDLMRNSLGAPIEWSAERNSFWYTRSCDLLPLVTLTPVQAFALALVASAFGSCEGSPFGDELAAGLKALSPIIGGMVGFPLKDVRKVISCPRAPRPGELRHLYILVRAMLEHRELRITYTKPGAAAAETRIIHPVHLAPLSDGWTLFARDTARNNEERTFVLMRVGTIEHTGKTFPPPDFDPVTRLRDNLGRYTGTERHEVRLAFDKPAAFYARERWWNESKNFSELPDGRTLLTLQTNNLIDIKRHVFDYGDQVEVLSPPALREEIRRTHAGALAKHSRAVGPV